ncbi:MAG TPA: hypothetical protein VJT82_06435 [Pyrinomonadaceae bacterium]|nr:hypothetical protein [Pyrinomonadaceae bacterium]
MSEKRCSCASFEKLEGASVPAYIAAFLDDMGRADPAKKNLYRCRVCGSDWERRAPEVRGEGRPSLVKIG